MTWAIFHEQVLPIRHKLYRFALRITGSVQEAEDVVQEVLEKVWKTESEQSERVQNWEAWCMTLTKNRSLDKTRSQVTRRTAPLEGVAERSSEGQSPAQTVECTDLVQKVKQYMQYLPEQQRMVMHLRDIEELSYEEISASLAIPIDQVKVNLHRARKAIREKMLALTRLPHLNTTTRNAFEN